MAVPMAIGAVPERTASSCTEEVRSLVPGLALALPCHLPMARTDAPTPQATTTATSGCGTWTPARRQRCGSTPTPSPRWSWVSGAARGGEALGGGHCVGTAALGACFEGYRTNPTTRKPVPGLTAFCVPAAFARRHPVHLQ